MLADNAQRYGRVTRTLHWVMATLFVWQFAGMLLKDPVGRTPLMGFWVGTHASVGVLLFVLIIIRLSWALVQRSKRPSYGPGLIGKLAALGHMAMYGLMVIVPSLGILRMIGGERPIALFGVSLRGPGQDVAWMTEPANLVHGVLAWTLLALVAGHVLMVLVHRLIWRDDTLARMIGK